MPSNWLYIDTNFPSFTQKESANDKIETMQDYLFMLVEQLRYTLHNLDLSNMNRAAADGIAKMITDPIYAEIQDAESNITQLGVTAQGLAARMSDAEGNITQLSATASGLQASITDLNGGMTNLKVDVNGLRASVSGKIDGSQAQTLIDQSLDKITLSATSGSSGTVFKISKDGAELASTGSVDLHVKSVNIDGTLTAEAIQGNYVSITDDYGNERGKLNLISTLSGDGLQVQSVSGGMSIYADGGNIFLKSSYNPQILLGADPNTGYTTIGLSGGYLVLSDSYMFDNSLPTYAPYGTIFFVPS